MKKYSLQLIILSTEIIKPIAKPTPKPTPKQISKLNNINLLLLKKNKFNNI